MKKIRVYELAKEVGIESKDLTAKLIELGYDVKAYNSTLEEETADEIRSKIGAMKSEAQRKKVQTQARATTTIIRRRVHEAPVAEAVESEAAVGETVAPAPPEPEVAPPAAAAAPEPVPLPEPEVAASSEEETKPSPKRGAAKLVSRPPAAAPVAEPEPVPPVEIVSVPEPAPVVEAPPVAESVVPEVAVTVEAPPSPEAEAPAPEAVAGEEAAAVEPRKLEKSRTVVVIDQSRKGFARVIKKAAITIPPPEEARPQVRRPPVKPKGKPGEAPVRLGEGLPVLKGINIPPDPDADLKGGLKGKKGKRFVKFTNEPGVKTRKGPVKRAGEGDLDIEEVNARGGRLASSLRQRGVRGGGKKGRNNQIEEVQETKAIKKRIKIFETISIGDFAHRMGVKVNEVIAKLMGLGIMATVNQSLDIDSATLVANDFGFEVELAVTEESGVLSLEGLESGGEEISRPPVVTVMGHVDHGKTSILDAIRNTDVAAGEAGGITQHIGAHYVRSAQGDIVFLDTPGHAAFTEMRSRGAKVTDVVVLVVAADDGVMDQTREAINHAKAAEVPIVVAVNKIDKPGADPARVKRELADLGLVPEEWGGSTIFCETSAKKNLGIEELLSQILLQAEVLELKADPKRKARGRVVEAHLHKGRGAVATILVQQGTLRVGDSFVVGDFPGKVRSVFNDKGVKVTEAGPAMPVEVQGLGGVPRAGDEFVVVTDDKMAKNVSAERMLKSRETILGMTSKISLDNFFDKLNEGEVKELRVLLRSDVQGTLEAFGKALEELSTDLIKVKILHQGTGTIIDSDILLAAASNAIIIGFNVRPSSKIQEFANAENVDIRTYNVIYHALDDIKKAMVGLLDPVYEERILGTVEVRDVFSVSKIGTIAGCYVQSGKIERNSKVRVIREGIVLHTGKISSLKRFKDDVKEVATGYECGIGVENFNDIKMGDTLEAFVMDQLEPTL